MTDCMSNLTFASSEQLSKYFVSWTSVLSTGLWNGSAEMVNFCGLKSGLVW